MASIIYPTYVVSTSEPFIYFASFPLTFELFFQHANHNPSLKALHTLFRVPEHGTTQHFFIARTDHEGMYKRTRDIADKLKLYLSFLCVY